MPKLNSGVSEATAENPGFMNSDAAANRAMLYLKRLADIFLTLWWKNSIDLLHRAYVKLVSENLGLCILSHLGASKNMLLTPQFLLKPEKIDII